MSGNTDEAFFDSEIERLRKLALEQGRRIADDERERLRELHWLRCAKCGMQMETVMYAGLQMERCFHCGGTYMDQSEIEKIARESSPLVHGLVARLQGPEVRPTSGSWRAGEGSTEAERSLSDGFGAFDGASLLPPGEERSEDNASWAGLALVVLLLLVGSLYLVLFQRPSVDRVLGGAPSVEVTATAGTPDERSAPSSPSPTAKSASAPKKTSESKAAPNGTTTRKSKANPTPPAPPASKAVPAPSTILAPKAVPEPNAISASKAVPEPSTILAPEAVSEPPAVPASKGSPAPKKAAPANKRPSAKVNPASLDYDGLLVEGRRRLLKGRASEALGFYEEAAKRKPGSSEALSGMGWSYLKLRKPHVGVVKFEQALKRNPRYGDAYIGLGQAHRSLGAADKSVEAYKRYLSLHPKGPSAKAARRALEAAGR